MAPLIVMSFKCTGCSNRDIQYNSALDNENSLTCTTSGIPFRWMPLLPVQARDEGGAGHVCSDFLRFFQYHQVHAAPRESGSRQSVRTGKAANA